METKDQLKKTGPELAAFLNTLNMPEIKVTVKEGVVTLSGTVETEEKKNAARSAVASVMGVKAILNHIRVSPFPSERDKDHEIAEAILSAIQLCNSFRVSRENDDREMNYWEIFT